MATKETKKKKVPTTPVGTVSYPHLFEAYSESGKYEMALIFPPGADTKELEELVEAAALAKWPKKRPGNFRHPLRPNEEKEGAAGYVEGGHFIKLKSTSRPKVVDKKGNVLTEDDVYPGMQAIASYGTFAYSKDGGNGVTLILVNVQKVAEGEPLAGIRSNPEDDFEFSDDDEVNDALA